jgi:hypothetical protein
MEVRMRKPILLLAVWGLAGSLWGGDPAIGTWKLNAHKTKVTGPAVAISKNSTVKIEAQENGVKFTWNAVKADGKAINGSFAAKYDGRDYPVKGDPTTDTVSLRRIDLNTVEFLFKKNGKEVLSERAVVSKDGKTITLTVKSEDAKGQPYEAILLYDRQ